MSHKKLRPFIVKVSVLGGYFPLPINNAPRMIGELLVTVPIYRYVDNGM